MSSVIEDTKQLEEVVNIPFGEVFQFVGIDVAVAENKFQFCSTGRSAAVAQVAIWKRL